MACFFSCASPGPRPTGPQKDLAVTGRVDINSFWLFKVEMHFIDGTASLSSSFTVRTTLYF